jgi:Bacterial pre-peptidase C-terminal domain
MLKRTQLYQAVAAALFLAAGAGNSALAVDPVKVDEVEPKGTMGVNDSIRTAQRLVFTSRAPMEINGVIGVDSPAGTPIPDLDFYSFEAQAGDVLEIDIDAGMKPNADQTQVRNVDTYLAIFGPLPDVAVKRANTRIDATQPRDPGSDDVRDALIRNFAVERNGIYVVGVSSDPRAFVDGGGTTNSTVTGRTAQFPNGTYKLVVSGVTPAVLQVNIEIKPGSGAWAPLNPKSRGNIPIALLSSERFDALTVKHDSLTFGSTGDEYSYLRCGKEGLDVNADGRLDLVCHFDNVAAKWQSDDIEGIVKGTTTDNKRFEGRGILKVVPKAHE